jgi:hypothetical protein
MTAAAKTASSIPRLEIVQDLLRTQEPCVSVLLPPYRPGGQAKSHADLLKTSLQEATRQLEEHRIPPDVGLAVLDPLHQLLATDELQAGSQWSRILYRSAQTLQQFLHIQPFETTLVVGRHFYIRPVLNALHLPPQAYVLKITQKKVELLRVAPFFCEKVTLPGVPETLEEALALDWPDHNLMNRKTAGHSVGTMAGVQFSTDSFRETLPAYLTDYYKMVDRAISQLLNSSGIPLILAGVAEDIVLYRQAATYRHVLEETIAGSPTAGSPSWKSDEELIRITDRILRNDLNRRSVVALNQAYEKLRPARLLTNIDRILDAVAEGRVHQLYLNQGARHPGLPGNVKKDHWGEEDLLNLAAVETFLYGGQAFELPSVDMPDHTLAAAVLRY